MAVFELKKTYNFNMASEAITILGDKYTLMKVKAIMDSTNAVKYSDIYTTHEQLKYIISGISENIDELTYILFENSDGTEVIYALEYIDTDTVEEVESINVSAKIANVSTEDIAIIKARLLELGYTNIEMSTYE